MLRYQEKNFFQAFRIKKTDDEGKKSIDYLSLEQSGFRQAVEQKRRTFIVARSAESGRTPEWVEISMEYKRDHYECEYCGDFTSDIHCHDILPYRQLTEGQRRNRDFLKQNLVSLCIEHHYNVAHLGDPYCLKFEPRIREICERHAKVREEQERDAKRTEELRSYIKKVFTNKVSVEKMIPDYKRSP